MLLAAFVWVFVLVTMRTMKRLDYWTTEGWFVGWGWGLLTTAALGWAVVNAVWAKKAISELRFTECYAHWVIAICCGLTTLGLHFVSEARSHNEGAKLIDPQSLLPVESTVDSLSGPIYGRTVRGKGWFQLTCVTCHGPTGEGLNNLAPSLKDSEFLKTADPVAINVLIRRGRAVTDPANKSGKPMPPRGGDPKITDEMVADLVAYVMSFHSRTADPNTLSWEGVDAPPPTLSRRALSIRPQNSAVRAMNLVALKVHGVFVAAVLISTFYLVIGWLRGWPPRRCRPLMFVNTWGWIVALGGWLSILLVLGMVDWLVLGH
jgi:hypothetical protein